MASNQSSTDGPVTKIEVDKNDERLVNIGVKISDLKEYNFDKTKLNEATGDKTNSNKGKWIGIDLRVLAQEDVDNKNTNVTCDDENVIIDNNKSQNSQVSQLQKAIYVWFKADKAGDTTFTLKYDKGDIHEKLPVTFRVHDASDVEITSVEAVDTNAHAILNAKAEKDNGKVTFDTYKYAMTPSYDDDGKISRPYTLQFTTNVPIDSIKQKTGIGSTADDWKDIATKTGDNTFTLTLNADTDNDGYNLVLANEYGKESSDGVPDNDKNKKEYTVAPTEKSVTEMENSSPVAASILKKKPTVSALTGVDVEENIHSDLLSGLSENLTAEEKKKETLEGSATKSSEIKAPTNKKDDKTGDFTAEITINSKDFGEISVNDIEGKWMLLHFAVRGGIKNIVDENNIEDGVFVDNADASELLTNTSLTGKKTDSTPSDLGNEKLYRVPVWINLSSNKVRTAITKGEAFEVKFGSNNPVEEHNSFFLKITDENKVGDTSNVEAPKKPTISSKDVGANKTENNKTVMDKYFEKDKDDTNGELSKKLLENAEKIKNIKVEPNDDFIYVRVEYKDSFIAVDSATPVVPLTLDISPLKGVPGDKLMHKGSSGEWTEFFEEGTDYTDETADFGLYLNEDAKVDNNGRYVKDIYIGKGASADKINSVLHYIIEFVPENK